MQFVIEFVVLCQHGHVLCHCCCIVLFCCECIMLKVALLLCYAVVLPGGGGGGGGFDLPCINTIPCSLSL